MLKKSMLLLIVLLGSTVLWAQQGKEGEPGADEKAWMEFMMPGKEHQMMAKLVGNWKMETEWYMEPGGPAQKSEGVCENAMIMGGRYLQGSYKGSMMGMPFEGKSLQGFDNMKKKYVAIWLDNMGTGITMSEGEYDVASHTLIMKGSMSDPASGQPAQYRTITKMIDDNHHVFEMYMPMPGGEEFKMMVINYTRAQ